jgi:hypothetical protein
MEPRPSRLDVFLAEWVLGHVDPDAAVQRATQALAAGCDDAWILSIAVLDGSKATTHAEIEDELPSLPSRDEALKTLVDDCAWAIVEGDIDPVEGASRMWSFWVNDNEGVEFLSQVRAFVDLVSDVPRSEPAGNSGAIVAEARAFLDRGGLQ